MSSTSPGSEKNEQRAADVIALNPQAREGLREKLKDNAVLRTPIPGPDDPYGVAEIYTTYSASEPTLGRLVHWQSEFYRYRNGCYRRVSAEDLDLGEVRPWLSKQLRLQSVNGGTRELPWKPTDRSVSNVMSAIASVVHLPSDTSPRSWIGTAQDPQFSGKLDLVIPTTNGILHVGAERQERWMECTPDFFCLSAIRLSGTSTGFFREYREMIGMDGSDCEYYAELNGAAMSNWWPEQVAHLKVGAPRTGKGTLKSLTMKLVGNGAVSISMQALSEHLEREPLIGASYVSVPEHRESSNVLKSSMAFFLRATGGDQLDIGRKNKKSWNGVLHALWDFDANSPSVFRDPSGAAASRFVGMHFTKSFRNNEDPSVSPRLFADLDMVFEDALDGLHRLIARGRFTRPERWQVIEDELWSSTSIEMSFLEDYCNLGSDRICSQSLLYQSWKEFCSERGYHPGPRDAAIARIRSAADTLSFRLQPGRLSAKDAAEHGFPGRVRVVRGISLKRAIPLSIRKFVPEENSAAN